MHLRLKSLQEVRLFSLTITVLVMFGTVLLHRLMLPADLALVMRVPGVIMSAMLAAPTAYYIGLKLLDVHLLTAQLEHVVDHDMLTGVSTRTSFYKKIEGQLTAPLAVIVADIDYFKNINDKYGHQSGDLALKQFTASLVRNCREDDIVARFGGEEFVILLQNAGLKEGLAAANRLCQRIREKPLVLNGKQVQITASFGVAQLDDVVEVDRAINQADFAVYRAKQSGRDQVCAFDPKLDIAPTPVVAAAQENSYPRPISASSNG